MSPVTSLSVRPTLVIGTSSTWLLCFPTGHWLAPERESVVFPQVGHMAPRHSPAGTDRLLVACRALGKGRELYGCLFCQDGLGVHCRVLAAPVPHPPCRMEVGTCPQTLE